jgi:hypothetical protein
MDQRRDSEVPRETAVLRTFPVHRLNMRASRKYDIDRSGSPLADASTPRLSSMPMMSSPLPSSLCNARLSSSSEVAYS